MKKLLLAAALIVSGVLSAQDSTGKNIALTEGDICSKAKTEKLDGNVVMVTYPEIDRIKITIVKQGDYPGALGITVKFPFRKHEISTNKTPLIFKLDNGQTVEIASRVNSYETKDESGVESRIMIYLDSKEAQLLKEHQIVSIQQGIYGRESLQESKTIKEILKCTVK